jgi:hypothetical protein
MTYINEMRVVLGYYNIYYKFFINWYKSAYVTYQVRTKQLNYMSNFVA